MLKRLRTGESRHDARVASVARPDPAAAPAIAIAWAEIAVAAVAAVAVFGMAPPVNAVLVLTAWIAAAGWAARRWFRWEPRR